MRRRLSLAAFLALALVAAVAAPASAAPDNGQTLRFHLSCSDGNEWQASFNGGPAAFHLDGGGLYVWKEISYVTPGGDTGTIGRGINGFAGAPTVTCRYTGAVSGNDYTVVGFYPPAA